MQWKEAKDAGNKAYQAGDIKQAIEHYSTSLKDEGLPDNERPTILCNRAQAFLKTGSNESAIEDCTACLTIAPDNVKALYRRASAYEATKQFKDALRDYQRTVEVAPGLPDAVSGVNRCQAALGIVKTVPKKSAAGPPSTSGGRGGSTLSPEDTRAFAEIQERVRDIALAKLRAQEQQRVAVAEKRKADLTISQLTPLPAERPVYTSLGRMFVRSPKDEILSTVTAAGSKAEAKIGVCSRTLTHLEAQEKEADAAFTEFIALARKRGEVRVRT